MSAPSFVNGQHNNKAWSEHRACFKQNVKLRRCLKARASTQLGSSDLQISKIGLGAIKWGDPGQGFGKRFNEADLKQVFQTAVDNGVNFFDTAEVYGYQGIKSGTSSENILGHFLSDLKEKGPNPVIVGTKFFTIPWTNLLVGGGLRLGSSSIREALTASLQRLGRADLYQVHFPFPTMPQKVIAEALTEIVDKGLAKSVGVCNYDANQLKDLQGLLSKSGISLVSNQVKFSVLERKPLKTELIQACKDLDVTLVAHSPLAQGKLTEKHLDSLSEGEKIRPLLKLLQFIGAISGGRSVAQVALNYLVAKGAVPIPGAVSVSQVKDIVRALEWELDENEVATIDEKLESLGM